MESSQMLKLSWQLVDHMEDLEALLSSLQVQENSLILMATHTSRQQRLLGPVRRTSGEQETEKESSLKEISRGWETEE